MANSTKTSVGRGRGRARGIAPEPVCQSPHLSADSEFAHSSATAGSTHTSSTTTQGNVSTYDPGAGGDTLSNSRLSADADEFFPRGYKAVSNKVSGDVPTAPPPHGKMSAVEAATCLTDVVNSITLEPATYETALQIFLESFGLVLSDPDTLAIVLSIIIEQSIAQPNFRYHGARLCNELNKFLSDAEIDFRTTLLSRCKEEAMSVTKFMDGDPARLRGFVCFLAELYIQFELKPGTGLRINILADVLYDLLKILLAYPTMPDNIKCLCMTLKLAGYCLDQYNSSAMDKLMQGLGDAADFLSDNKTVATMVANIKQLRLSCWGTNSTPECNTTAAVENTEPVFYGPDGKILTPEESAFLQENVTSDVEYHEELWFNGDHFECDDNGEMNEEEEAAYEEFLRMHERSKEQQQQQQQQQ